MRSVFFLLLAANFAVWAWSTWLTPSALEVGSFAPKLPRILLASELPPPPPVPPAPPRCIAIGPFLAPDEVSKAGRLLEDEGFQPSVRTSKGEVAAGYVVMATGISSMAAQARTLARLHKAGFRDAAPHSDAADDSGVTVGKFEGLSRARARAAAAERMGVHVSVMQRTQPGKVFWLEFALGAQATASPESLQSTLGGAGNALKVEACESQPPAAGGRG